MRDTTVFSKDWAGRLNALVHSDDPTKHVHHGDTVTDRHGTKWIVTGGRAPHKPSSTGRVWVESTEHSSEFFPSVFGFKWLPEVTS